MPTESVLVEVVTAANMAGVEEAKLGMLGLSATALGVGLALAAVVIVGKAAVENYKHQEEATNQLKQATDAYNETAGTTITTVGESAKVIQAAQDAASKATDALTISTGAAAKAQMAYTDAVKKHGAESQQATIAAINLNDANIRLKQVQDANTDAQAKLAAVTATSTTEVYRQGINLADLTAKYEAFKQANAGFISDQYDTETALAAIVRSGENETDAMRILNDALDLAAIKHEAVSDAAKSLDLALAGNGKSLKELGITTEEYTAIMHDKTLTTEQQHLKLLDLIETKTRNGRDVIDQTTQAQNKLTIEWQDFTARTGPAVASVMTGIADAATAALEAIMAIGDALGQAGSWLESVSGLGAAAGNRAGVSPHASTQPTVTHDPTTHALLQQLVANTSGGGSGQLSGPQYDILANGLLQRARHAPGT